MSIAAKLRKKAAELEALKQFDRAIAAYVSSIERSEKDGEEVDVAVLNKVGDLTLRQGRVSDAVTYYERAVEHYATVGLFNNAIALCNKILRNAPGRSNVYFTLGRICARKGLRGDATRNFLEYATRMQKEGRVDEGMRALAEVADLTPDLVEIRQLVDEHAVRAGITLTRRKTPESSAAQPEPDDGDRSLKKSADLVFLDLDSPIGNGGSRPTPAAARAVTLTPAKPVATTTKRPTFSSSLDAILLFDPDAENAAPAPAEFDVDDVVQDVPARPTPEPVATAGTADIEPVATPDEVPSTPAGFVETAPDFVSSDDGVTPLEGVTLNGVDGSQDVTADDAEPDAGRDGEEPLLSDEPHEIAPMDGLVRVSALDDQTVAPMADLDRDPQSDPAELTDPAPALDWIMPDDRIVIDEAPSDEPVLLAMLDTESGAVVPPPFRLDPHDFILPGELPPLVLSDSIVEAGLSGAMPETAPRVAHATPSIPIAAVAAEASVVAVSRRDSLRSAVGEAPRDWMLRRRLAEALFEAGERDAALAELETAVGGHLEDGQVEDAAELADVLVRVAGERIQYHQKRVELAVRLQDQGRLRLAYLDLGDGLLQTGDDVRARAVYARVLEMDPLDNRARSALGVAAPPAPDPVDERPDDEHVDLVDWLRDDKEPASTRMRMHEPVVSGDEQADFDALLRHFKEGVARSLGEEDYESHYDLGVAFKEMGLLDDAIGEFQKALRSRSHRLPAYEALGQCFVEQERYQVAATVLSRALHEPGLSDDQRVGVLYLLAYSSEALQRWDEAKSYYQRVYATDINFRDAAARLAALDLVAR
ncbi:MAG: tetratricopeptide repeat protein [Gemmatimonadota bacterium]